MVAVALVGTAAAVFATRRLLGLRPSVEHEIAGLDYLDHGERGWHLEEN